MPAPGFLERIYGEASTVQAERYATALEVFQSLFGPGPVQVFRAPGRVNMIGEHTDYNQGFVLPVALDRDVLLFARTRADRSIHLHNLEARFAPCVFDLGLTIPAAPPGDWSNYARGAAQMVASQLGDHALGMDGLIVGAPPLGVPRGAGLSSSSALTVVSALSLARLNGWQPDPVVFAQLCSDAEWYVGTRGGIMDQFISLLAVRERALFLDCRPSPAGDFTFAHVSLPSGYRLLVVDSGVHHANVRGEFNLRVAACRAGVACLRDVRPTISYLRDVQDVRWPDLSKHLPERMTVAQARSRGAHLDDVPLPDDACLLRVRACCRHVHGENARVLAMVSALEVGDIHCVELLLNEAHASARDDYDISCPEIEALVDAVHTVPGTAGVRLTGAGWGGCVVALVCEDAVPEFEVEVPRRYHRQTGLHATAFPCRAGGRAGHVADL